MNVLLDNEQGTQLVLSRTSGDIGNVNQAFSWHVAANEGLNLEDRRGRRASAMAWVKRGLREELYVTDQIVDDPRSSVKFLNLVLDRMNLEIDLHCRVRLPLTFERLKMLQPIARDGRRETDEIQAVAYTHDAIAEFRRNNTFVSYAPALLDALMVTTPPES